MDRSEPDEQRPLEPESWWTRRTGPKLAGRNRPGLANDPVRQGGGSAHSRNRNCPAGGADTTCLQSRSCRGPSGAFLLEDLITAVFPEFLKLQVQVLSDCADPGISLILDCLIKCTT